MHVFWNNAAETYVDIKQSSDESVVSPLKNLVSGQESHQQTHWFSESGIIDLYLMIEPSPKDVIRQYTVPSQALEILIHSSSLWIGR